MEKSSEKKVKNWFFIHFGILVFMSATPFIAFPFDKSSKKVAFVLIDGWALKKRDINAIDKNPFQDQHLMYVL